MAPNIGEVLAVPARPDPGWVVEASHHSLLSALPPVYTVEVSTDLTYACVPGTRIRLTQGGLPRYFILLAIGPYWEGRTQLALYGGAGYALDGSPITDVSYSPLRAPWGFPLSPATWRQRLLVTADLLVNNPAADTVYALGASLAVPQGRWTLSWRAAVGGKLLATAGMFNMAVGLGTDPLVIDLGDELTVSLSLVTPTSGPGAGGDLSVPAFRSRSIELAAPATYHLSCSTTRPQLVRLAAYAGRSPLIIEAACAYL